MNTIICEKPSQAKDIAKGLDFDLSQFKSNSGYVQDEKYYITWGYGHLCSIDNSILKDLNVEQLPVFPGRFEYVVPKDKKKQFDVVKKLVNDSENVIIATDAGREGELIARLILIKSGYKNFDNVYRFWSSQALTKDVVKRGMDKLKPANEYNYLFYRGISRQHSDWLVGINLSMIVSMKAKGKWSVGRVQTPTLKFIHDRYWEHKNFQKQKYYVVEVVSKDGIKGNIETKERLGYERACKICQDLKSIDSGVVTEKKVSRKEKKAPGLLNLNDLQSIANDRFGFDADKTLKIAQSLYETHKVLSYPRTESRVMADDNIDYCKNIVDNLDVDNEILNKVDVSRPGKKVYDSEKLADHHALVPMAEKVDGMSEDEIKIYDVVKSRFLAAFMDKYIYDSVIVNVGLGDYSCKFTGKIVKNQGWKLVWNDGEEEEEENGLMNYSKGDDMGIKSVEMKEKETKPPKLFTDSMILKKMEKEGLGTAATRAAIISKLYNVGYVDKSGKKYVVTEKGQELIDKLDGSNILSVGMTADWENYLAQLENKKQYREFLEKIKKFTREETERLKKKEIKAVVSEKKKKLAKKLAKEQKVDLNEDKLNDSEYVDKIIEENKDKKVFVGDCGCGGKIEDKGKLFVCNNEDCGAKIFKKFFGKELNSKNVVQLLQGKQIHLKGLKSKKGKKFEADCKYQNGRVELIFNY